MTTIDAPSETFKGSLPSLGPAWVTWRQHRFAFYGLLTLLGVFALLMLVGGMQVRSTYDEFGLDRCSSFSSGSCGQLADQFRSKYQTPKLLLMFVLLLPGAFGAFVGGPLVARELETGTYRFAWTQGAGRTRWILTKLFLIAGALVLVTAAYGPLYSWWNAPFDHVGPTGFNDYIGFELEGIVFPVQTLLAFVLGVFAGLVIRRTVIAVATVFLGSFGLLMGTVFLLRKHYMTPLTTSGAPGPRDWVTGNTYLDQAGHRLSPGQGHDLYQRFLTQVENPSAVLPQGAYRHWLEAQHYTVLANYHPADRFWSFQLIETGWMGLLILLIGFATVWLIRRRVS